jgi:predicted RNase H-like HicB family nuclease
MESRESTYSPAIEKHDGGYLAYFPSLPGCTTWGPTYEAAVKNAEEALALYLETLSENGDAIPQESTRKTISLSVTVRTPIIA